MCLLLSASLNWNAGRNSLHLKAPPVSTRVSLNGSADPQSPPAPPASADRATSRNGLYKSISLDNTGQFPELALAPLKRRPSYPNLKHPSSIRGALPNPDPPPDRPAITPKRAVGKQRSATACVASALSSAQAWLGRCAGCLVHLWKARGPK